MRTVNHVQLAGEIYDVQSALVRRKSKVNVLFNEDFSKLLLFPNYSDNGSYIQRRKYRVVGEYNAPPPTYDELFEACVKVLEANNVSIVWDE